MGNHAAAVRLAHRPSEIGPLSDHAIRYLVDSFYAKVRADSELGPIFKRAIPGDWGPHLATMHDFWSSIMLTSGRYKGNSGTKRTSSLPIQMSAFRHVC